MEQYRFYQPTRIQFGTGSLDRIGEVTAAYGKKCMLVTTTNTEDVLRPLYDRVKSLLQRSGLEVVHFDKVVPNPTVQNIESAIELVNREQIEVLVAVAAAAPSIPPRPSLCFTRSGRSTGSRSSRPMPARLNHMTRHPTRCFRSLQYPQRRAPAAR